MDTATDALLDPQRQFLGCVMQLPTGPARRLLAGMRADDLTDPMAANALQLAIEVLAEGHAPAPVALYAHAVATGNAPGTLRRERLSGWLFDTYRNAPPPALADHLKEVVLEAAWRHALTVHALRVLHAAEASPTDLLHDLAADTAADELWTRYRHATGNSGAGRLGVAA